MASIFTKIINRELPAEIIYEDDICISFLDKFPIQPGHFLVVPKKESKNVLEMDQYTINHCVAIAKKLAKERVIDKGIPAFKLLVNTGSEADQTVFHTHFHIIPYSKKCHDN
ncbi:histidine triad protein HinT [Mycoplasma sp. Mirounga ES2805-ORL]|uniref:histidine triad protein HinT n=1 Tax=Mycoplasma sp. Mirounga ES2805-ORL TaxID=754514 RepID=UPI00197BA564|nr:HIT family protein [Mycoplasma sp. Mirounga ES2805-ORL]QSF13536.1 HIT family protein [Mycoplasma sp. Mirounga ES2805-ORL]